MSPAPASLNSNQDGECPLSANHPSNAARPTTKSNIGDLTQSGHFGWFANEIRKQPADPNTQESLNDGAISQKNAIANAIPTNPALSCHAPWDSLGSMFQAKTPPRGYLFDLPLRWMLALYMD
jgi:hypothetical protein